MLDSEVCAVNSATTNELGKWAYIWQIMFCEIYMQAEFCQVGWSVSV